MSPLLVQGLFHLYWDVLFFLIGWKLWTSYKIHQNPLAKYIALSVIFAGIEYLFFVVSIFVFPDNLYLVKVANNISWVFVYLAIGCAWVAFKYIYPKFPLKLFLMVLGSIGAVMLYLNSVPFTPAFINSGGFIDWGDVDLVMMVGSILLMGTFVPMGLSFIYRTLKKRFVVKGLVFGLGFVVTIVFMPATYSVESLSTYIFLAMLAALGMTLVTVGVFLSVPEEQT